jgi:dynactin 1
LNKQIESQKQETKDIKDEFDLYKDEMSTHEQRLEEITVDKELAEARIEELEDTIQRVEDKCEEYKLELEVLKGEIELNGVDGASSSFQTKQLEKELERLKSALIKLRDMSIKDKTDIANKSKQCDDLAAKLKQITKENENFKAEKNDQISQINDLKDQLVATMGSVQIIEQLTEQNLDLEAKVMELQETIVDLEAINEVNDQLQESSKEEERELRQNLDLAECRTREFERSIELLKYTIADHEKTILKFRELVKQLQNDNDTLSRSLKLKEEDEKNNETTNQTVKSYDFKKKLIETKNLAKIVEQELNRIEIGNLKSYNNYLLTFMSDQFLKQTGDNECILTLLFFKRVVDKTDLILNQIKEKFANKDEEDASGNKTESEGFVSFYHQMSMILYYLRLLCNQYDYVLNNCDQKVFTNIGSLYLDFNIYERNLDVLIEFLQKDQFDENINLEVLEKMCNHFQAVMNNHLNELNIWQDVILIDDLIKMVTSSSDLITFDLLRINSFVQLKDDSAEIIVLLRELSSNNEELKNFLKKASRHLPKSNDNRSILLPLELRNNLITSISNSQRLSKTINEIYNLASSSTILSITNGKL